MVFEKFLEELKLKFGQQDARVVQVDSSLKKILGRLKANRTAVVSTIVGEDSLNIIVTTSRTQRAHTLKKSAEKINELVAKFRTALTSPQYDPRPTSQELYDLIVKPIEGDLAGIKADTIVWSLDGTLRYRPPRSGTRNTATSPNVFQT
jgi:CHAT domain-containing protein